MIDRYGTTTGLTGRLKWLDTAYWLYEKILWTDRLGLYQSQGQRILDLGAGGGHFCVVARNQGHEPVALDRDDDYFSEICTLLGVERVVHTIARRRPLPDLGRFDLITAFNVNFNHRAHGPWRKADWRWFLNHLILSQLRPGGRIFLTPNKLFDRTTGVRRPDHELAEVFLEHGGKVGPDTAWLDLVADEQIANSARKFVGN